AVAPFAQALDQLGETLELALLLGNDAAEQVAIEDRLPNRDPGRVRRVDERRKRLLTDAATRDVDDPAERDSVRRIHDVAQVREHVFDLGALIETDAADDAIRNPL